MEIFVFGWYGYSWNSCLINLCCYPKTITNHHMEHCLVALSHCNPLYAMHHRDLWQIGTNHQSRRKHFIYFLGPPINRKTKTTTQPVRMVFANELILVGNSASPFARRCTQDEHTESALRTTYVGWTDPKYVFGTLLFVSVCRRLRKCGSGVRFHFPSFTLRWCLVSLGKY